MSISSRTVRWAAGLTLVVMIALASMSAGAARAEPVQDQQCQDHTWRKLHPQICDRYHGDPFGFGGSTPHGGGGGLIGRVLDAVGGLL